MGPITFHSDIWLPVEPADRPARGDLALTGEKGRRIDRHVQRRRRQEESDPDADEFAHIPEENQSDK